MTFRLTSPRVEESSPWYKKTLDTKERSEADLPRHHVLYWNGMTPTGPRHQAKGDWIDVQI